MKKKLMSAMLCSAMVMSMVSVTALAEEGEATYNIGYANQALKEDFFITVENSIYTACQERGYEYNIAITDRDSTKMTQGIEALVTKGADIIIDFDCLPEAGEAMGEELAKEGIPMMSVDADYGENVYFFGVNNYEAGVALGESLSTFVDEKFGGELDYVVALWDSQSGDTVKERCTGATDTLQEKYGLSEDQVVWLDSMADDVKTQSMTRDWLDSHPDAEKVVFVGQNDDRGYAINQAIIAADRVENCLVGSHNADPSAVENLQKYIDDPMGTAWVTTVSYNSFLYGEQIIEYATDILEGNAEGEMQRYAETSPLTTENVEDYVAERDEVTASFIEH